MLTLLKLADVSFSSCTDCFSLRFKRAYLTLKYFLTYFPISILTGCLYAKMILKIRKMAKNDRKATLISAFVCLWACWLLFTLPFSLYEIFVVSTGSYGLLRTSEGASLLGQVARGHTLVTLSAQEFAVLSVKQSFGIVNSLILLVLVKPFRKPVINLFNLIRKQKDGKN